MSKLSKMIREAQERKQALAQMPQKLAETEARLERLARIEAQCAELAGLARQAIEQAEGLPQLRQWAERALADMQQTVNLCAAARPVGKKIKVVFLVHHIEAWDSIADIYALMREAEEFAPIVISIKRRFPGDKGFGFEEIIHEKLAAQNVPHLRFAMENSREGLDILKALAPDIIFKQSPWDADVPPSFAAAELNFARLCYVPYAVTCLVNTHDLIKERDPEVDSPLHRLAWKLFYATEDQRRRFAAHAVRQGDNLEIVGHPKVHRLQRLGAENPHWPIAQAGGRRFRLIWSPHHSIDNNWLKFGLFPAVYRHMLEWAKLDRSIEIVLSFHPAALARVRQGTDGVSAEQCETFLHEWDSLPNTARHAAGNYAGLMAASDCLISDGMSFPVEYQFFTKPMIFLERPDHLPFSEAGERIIRGVHPVADVAAARDLAHQFAAGLADDCAPIQRENTAWLAGNRLAGESAAARIIASIRRSLMV